MNNNTKLNCNQIKYIAIFAMTIDHIAWAFVDPANPLLGGIMHFFGRITGPTMAYLLAQGYHYTRDVGKYTKRLGIFAIISIIPFTFFENGTLPIYIENGHLQILPIFGVIYTLFLGLIAIRIWENEKYSTTKKKVLIILLCFVSIFGDWPIIDVLSALFFYIYRENKLKKWLAFAIVNLSMHIPMFIVSGFSQSWFEIGIFLVPILIEFFYNGKKGSSKPFHKWFFYVYYPLHLLVLGIIRWC